MGNTLTFTQFQLYLDETFPEHKLSIEEHFLPRMKDIIIDSFLSVRRKMNPNNRKGCFELFGFDFLMDEEFRLWLLEINTNPFLGTPNDDMRVLVRTMMEDMVRLVIDPVCKPKNQPVERESGFELIYREENQWAGITALNQRRSFNLDLSYPIPDLKPFIGKMHTSKKNISYKAKVFLKKIPQISLVDTTAEEKAEGSADKSMDKSIEKPIHDARPHSMAPQKQQTFRGRNQAGRTSESGENSQERQSYRKFTNNKSQDKVRN